MKNRRSCATPEERERYFGNWEKISPAAKKKTSPALSVLARECLSLTNGRVKNRRSANYHRHLHRPQKKKKEARIAL